MPLSRQQTMARPDLALGAMKSILTKVEDELVDEVVRKDEMQERIGRGRPCEAQRACSTECRK